METIKSIYKIGHGPSSSHTMGPAKAAERFSLLFPDAVRFEVTLYGSLAATGKGHLTDLAVINELIPVPTEIIWKADTEKPFHPNALTFKAFGQKGEFLGEKTYYSIGGGAILEENQSMEEKAESVYPHTKMTEIVGWCLSHKKSFWQYIEQFEDECLWPYLSEVWQVMRDAKERGLKKEGILPGVIGLPRKAPDYYQKAKANKGYWVEQNIAFSYALAVSEENASGGIVATAPTCGSCGIIPSVLCLLQELHHFSDEEIIRALATAALFGNVARTNASISGAEVGCQGEVGVACAMAAAAACQLLGGNPMHVEYAAEMGLEHHLGLTCDPVAGLVQLPCIERNAFAAVRAMDACHFALLSDGKHRVSFDEVVYAMKQTGHDLPRLYRETAEGGLAKAWDLEETDQF